MYLSCFKNINYLFVFRKVYLGHKKSNSEQMYAIKVMKKTDMINKNMITQGKLFILFNISKVITIIKWLILLFSCK